jgi:hypothetical protein
MLRVFMHKVDTHDMKLIDGNLVTLAMSTQNYLII